MKTKMELICVTCPRGCPLTVELEDGQVIQVEGNCCKRGFRYAQEEISDPRRMIASTVRIHGGIHPVVPVATSAPLPKGKIFPLMKLLADVTLQAPVKMDEVILLDVLGTGVDVIVTREMDRI